MAHYILVDGDTFQVKGECKYIIEGGWITQVKESKPMPKPEVGMFGSFQNKYRWLITKVFPDKVELLIDRDLLTYSFKHITKLTERDGTVIWEKK